MNRRAGLLFAAVAVVAAASVAEWPASDGAGDVEAALGTDVSADRATWSLFRGRLLHGVVLKDADGGAIRLGDVRLRGGEVEATGASIDLVRTADGWRLPPLPAPAAPVVVRLRDGRIRVVDEPWGLDVRLDRVAGVARLGPDGLVADVAGGAEGREGRWTLRVAPGEVEAHVAGIPLSVLRAGVGETPVRLDLVVRRPDSSTITLRHEARAGEGLRPDIWTKAAISTDEHGVCRGGLAFALRGSVVSALLGREIPLSGLFHYQGSFDNSPPSSPTARGRLNLPTGGTPAGPVEDLVSDACVVDSAGIRFDDGRARPSGGRLAEIRFHLDWAGPATLHAEARRGEETLVGEALVEALVGTSIDHAASSR